MARAKEVADTYRNKVRAGKCFRATYLNAALATTASDGVAIAVGSEPLYMQFNVTSSGSALIRLFEGPTVSASALLAYYNADRLDGASGAMSISTASTGTSPDFAAGARGTMIYESNITAIGAFGGGGDREDNVGWVLNTEKTYMICASNLQGATGTMGFQLVWYID
jgi:hypothetical protein